MFGWVVVGYIRHGCGDGFWWTVERGESCEMCVQFKKIVLETCNVTEMVIDKYGLLKLHVNI